MAPVYTAKHLSSSDKTTPLFSLKGLVNLSPTTLSHCGITGVALEYQPAYASYARHLAHFVKASLERTKIVIGTAALGPVDIPRRLPFTPPPVHFVLRKELSNDNAERLVRQLGPGASKTITGKTTCFQAPTIPPEMLDNIIAVAAPHFNAGREAVNPMGIAAYNFLSGCLSELLRVHSYSAFTFESVESQVELSALIANGSVTTKFGKNATADDRVQYSTHLSARKRMRDEGAMEEGEAPDWVEEAESAIGFLNSDMKDCVLTASPPKAPVVNVGSPSAVPNSPGLLFPYFHGMIQPDMQTMTSFVIRHLFLLLGSTVQSCQDRYSELRRGFNSLATTDVGLCLSHISFGLNLAIETQGRCFVIIESNRYLGFALLGARLAIHDSINWKAPVDADELRKDMLALDPHNAAVEKLVGMFRQMSTSGSYTGPAVTQATFEEPRSLIDVFAGVRMEEIGEMEKEVDQQLRCLNYMGQGYLQRNPQTIVEVMTTLLSESAIELGRPTYIPSLRAPLSSREFICLSRFGPEAPSLWNERGQEFECVAREAPVQTGSKRKIGDADIYTNLPIRLLVTPKPLLVAVKDMEKVISRRAIRIDLKERAGKYRSMSIEAESSRQALWKVLVDGLKNESLKKRRVEKKKDVGTEEGYDDAIAILLG
jgi:hypothetical protein